MTYAEQLQQPEWKLRRQEIISMNWGYCSCCGTSRNIHVHHKIYYDDGRMAWEYSDNELTTLCADCHMLEHDLVEVSKPKHIREIIYG